MNQLTNTALGIPFFETLPDVLAYASTTFGEQVIVHVNPKDGSEDHQTYRDLHDEAIATAMHLFELGWRPGDRIAFVINDSRLFVTCFWGCLISGIVPIPLSPLLNREEDSMEAEKILNVTRLANSPVLIDSRLHPHADLIEEIAARNGKAVHYADELVRDARVNGPTYATERLSSIDALDIAVLQYSSGSSGQPKGVRLTHRNIIANVKAQLEFSQATRDDVLCTWLPYFHDFGLFWGHIFPIYHGIKQVRLDPGHFARRPLVWLDKLHEHRATLTNSTPTALKHLIDYIELKQRKAPVGPYDLSSLRALHVGAEMINPADCRMAIQLLSPFGIDATLIQGGYGLTETTVVATACQIGTPFRTRVVDRSILVSSGEVVEVTPEHPNAAEFASVGRALPYCEIRVVDEKGAPVGVDRAGIVEIRGENVTQGYMDNPDADRQAFLHDDWFNSGDIGFLDREGFLTITGRAKEMIIVGGHNYFPWDIEQIAIRTPRASEMLRHLTVCGVWNPSLHREEVIAFIVTGRVSEEDLLAFTKAMSVHVNAVAGFPIDSFVRLQMKEVPRTSSGKVMRRVLLERLATGEHVRMESVVQNVAHDRSTGKRSPEAILSLLQTIWSESLGVPVAQITSDSSLFHLGCNSLMAYHIQGRLEESLGQRLETNFNYAHPVLKDQVSILVAIDPSLDAPKNDLEQIMRTVVHDVLEMPEHDISVTTPLANFAKGLSDAARMLAEISRVFDLSTEQATYLRGSTIRELSNNVGHILGIGSKDSAPRSRFPLMNFQETLYFHRKGFVRNEPSRLSCFIFIDLDIVSLEGKPIYPDILEKAFDVVISRNSMLRGVIDEGGDRPHMRILDHTPPFKVGFHDLSGLTESEADDYLVRRGRDINDIRFDITKWPMFIAELYLKPNGKYALLFNIDHLLIDGYSFMHLLQEVLQAYECLADNRPIPVASEELGFGDYVLIEAARQRTRSYQRAMARQLSLFDNPPTKPVLPGKTDPANIDDVWFDTHYHMLDANIVREMTVRASSHGITLNSLLLAVWFKLVNLWSGQDDLVINMPVFNREQYSSGARSVIGTFIDIFPVRIRTNPSENMLALGRKVENFTRELLSVPVSSIELSRKLAEREHSTSGSMSSLIFSNSIGVYGGDLKTIKKLDVENPRFRTGAPGTIIDLVLYDYEGDYYVNWNYIRDLFDQSFIETLAGQFQGICRSIVEQPAATEPPFDVLPVIPAEFQAVLSANNDTEHSFSDSTIPELVLAQAQRTPDAIALRYDDRSLSYRDLTECASRVANLLIERTTAKVSASDLGKSIAADPASEARSPFIALMFERGLDMIVAQLGVMMAGYAYVPIDPEYPSERIAYVLNDCRAPILITQRHLVERVPASTPLLKIMVVIDAPLDGKIQRDQELLDENSIARMPGTIPMQMPRVSDLAYMIYTSGSTGLPKGVMIPYRGIVNFLTWVLRFHQLTAKDHVALVTSYAFDMTLATNWAPLLCGACIHILHEEKTRDVEVLIKFLSKERITFLNVTPSQFSLLASAREHLALGDLPMAPSMRIMLGGEVINTKDLNSWLQHYPTHVFINEYGPTEVSVATTAFTIPVDEQGVVSIESVPIGKPLDNCSAYVLSPCNQPCMPGVAGELCLGGVGVALGYFNKPERTEAAFVADPFRPAGARMYRTGDMARIRPDGNIEFLGRQDHQINLKGFRIEAGEVEHALVQHPAVSQAVVSDQLDATGQRVLVAHIIVTASVEVSDLRDWLGERLPAYMVPSHIMQLDELPKTPSGKLDRKGLPPIRGENAERAITGRSPESGLERKLCSIWQDVLGIQYIGVDDNFWSLGGDSLRAMRLILRYKEEGIQNVGLREVFDYQTIGEVARYLEGQESNSNQSLISVIQAGNNPHSKLLLLPYACGSASSFVELTRLLPDDVSVLSVSPPDSWNDGSTDITAMAKQIIDALVVYEDELPWVVAGYSFGGVLASELVRQLELAEKAPVALVLIATAPPGTHQETDLILSADDESIVRYSREVYDFDTNALSVEELRSYLRQLRSQTFVMARHRFEDAQKLRTPTLNLIGVDEEDAELAVTYKRWETIFLNCTSEQLPGGHMLIKSHTKALAERLKRVLDASRIKGGGPRFL